MSDETVDVNKDENKIIISRDILNWSDEEFAGIIDAIRINEDEVRWSDVKKMSITLEVEVEEPVKLTDYELKETR